MSGVTEVALGDVASIVRAMIEPSEIGEGTFCVGLENITSGGGFNGVAVLKPGEVASTKFVFSKHEVLFGKLRPYLAKVARPNFGGVCSTDILPIAPGPRLDRDYLAHFLSQPATIALAAQRATGANLPRLSPKELEKFRLPLPSLEEQRRIARVLDFADALRAKRRKAISQVRILIGSIFHEMFVGGRDAWPTAVVADIAASGSGSIRTGPFGSQLLHGEFTDKGVAVLGIDNAVENEFRWGKPRYISAEKYQQLSRYTVHPGDVLITIMGTCGRTAIVPDDIPIAINTKHLCCITLNKALCLPEYLHAYFLRHPAAAAYLSSTAKGLSL